MLGIKLGRKLYTKIHNAFSLFNEPFYNSTSICANYIFSVIYLIIVSYFQVQDKISGGGSDRLQLISLWADVTSLPCPLRILLFCHSRETSYETSDLQTPWGERSLNFIKSGRRKIIVCWQEKDNILLTSRWWCCLLILRIFSRVIGEIQWCYY